MVPSNVCCEKNFGIKLNDRFKEGSWFCLVSRWEGKRFQVHIIFKTKSHNMCDVSPVFGRCDVVWFNCLCKHQVFVEQGDFVLEESLYANSYDHLFVIPYLISCFSQKWHWWVQQKQLKQFMQQHQIVLFLNMLHWLLHCFVYLRRMTSTSLPRISSFINNSLNNFMYLIIFRSQMWMHS